MSQTNLIGRNILGYTVSEELGTGEFGTVYKVIKANISEQYVRALKHITIPTERQYRSMLNYMDDNVSRVDSYFLQMINNIVSEIRIINNLSEKGGQHIVRYYENDILVTDLPRRYDIFILMEYLTPLEDFIRGVDFLVSDVIRLGLDVLNGLRLYHDNGIIHQDIKDNNIFVSNKGEYKIDGFDVSKFFKASSKDESLKGTLNFLAPEVYLGEEGYKKSDDLYSLGIVLYRLLNYRRNPFLPQFPEQLYAQDEDIALEKRMSRKTPDMPVLGGKEIGRAIVKAISNRTERFQTADEFINALEFAVKNTPPMILNRKIKFEISSYSELIGKPKAKECSAILERIAASFVSEEQIHDKRKKSVNKHLVVNIGKASPTDVQEVGSAIECEQKYKNESINSTILSNKNEFVVNVVVPTVNEMDEPATLNKNVMNKFMFLIPVVILLIGVGVYFIEVSSIHGEVIPYIDWMFTDSQNIIDALYELNVVLNQNNGIIGMRVFWRVWLAGLTASLFFVGKQFQSKPEPNITSALLIKKEPYFMIQNVTDALKKLRVRRSNKQLDSLIYEVKKLEEKLSVESDFGYGKSSVINCENNIARQLQFLLDTVPYVETGNFEENLKAMNIAVMNVNFLLRRRIELKKR